MPRSESEWRAEISAHVTLTCDLAELSLLYPDVSSWRVLIVEEEPDLKECLEDWEVFIQVHRLAVVIEQASMDGVLHDAATMASSLQGCPAEWRTPFDVFVQQALEPIRDYLVYACYCQVQIERERRTGEPAWAVGSPSGSPEVLSQLMFKWGPRFRRHRWTW